MEIDLMILDDNETWLKILDVVLDGKVSEYKKERCFTDVNKFLDAVTSNPTVIVLDYFLSYNITGVTVFKKVLKRNNLIHPIFMSSAASLEVYQDISDIGWGFFFARKDTTNFSEDIVEKITRAKSVLNVKMESVVRENDRKTSIRNKALETLKVLGDG